MVPKKMVKKKIIKGTAAKLRDNPLNQYMKEIEKIKILSREEEFELSAQIKKGNSWAVKELVRRNLKYVVTVANKYRGCGLALQDLIEEGNIGLIRAAERFDGSRHIKFITYANYWIRQAIIHSLAGQAGTVKIPTKQVNVVYKIGKCSESLRQDLEREPTRAEVAEAMGLTEEKIEPIMRAHRTPLSLDTPLNEHNETPYLELLENPNAIPYDDQLLNGDLKKKINDMLKNLTPKEEEVIRLRFGFTGDPMTLERVGIRIGLSRERVRQIEERAKKKLVQKSRDVLLKEEMNG